MDRIGREGGEQRADGAEWEWEVGEKKEQKIRTARGCAGCSFIMRGGDSFEWFINYLKYSIEKKCEQSMSIF